MKKPKKKRRTAEEIMQSTQNKFTVTCKVDKDVWLALDAIRESYGCQSIYTVVSGLIDMFCKHVATMERREAHRAKQPAQNIHEEIGEMFNELSGWEAPRYGERTKRGHKSWDYFGEQETTVETLIEEEDADKTEEYDE